MNFITETQSENLLNAVYRFRSGNCAGTIASRSPTLWILNGNRGGKKNNVTVTTHTTHNVVPNCFAEFVFERNHRRGADSFVVRGERWRICEGHGDNQTERHEMSGVILKLRQTNYDGRTIVHGISCIPGRRFTLFSNCAAKNATDCGARFRAWNHKTSFYILDFNTNNNNATRGTP